MSKIQWTERTWNPVIGCTKVSEGCRNCYAMSQARRMAGIADATAHKASTDAESPTVSPRMRAYREVVKRNDRGVPLPQWNNEVRCIDAALPEPLGWKKPAMVFVNSMSDLFHESVPFEFIDKVFAVMALCPHLTFQVLTKRPERMAEYLEKRGGLSIEALAEIVATNRGRLLAPVPRPNLPLPNVWLGTSAENQAAADQRIPHLLRCPAAVRFVSCEPLLAETVLPLPVGCKSCNHPGPQVFDRATCTRCSGTGQEYGGIDWVIVGGESGPGARPCDVRWIRQIVEHCQVAGVPVFVKQLGALAGMSHPTGDEVRQWGNTEIIEADDGVRLMLRDRKGGDPAEWPEDLCVREFPEVVSHDVYELSRAVSSLADALDS